MKNKTVVQRGAHKRKRNVASAVSLPALVIKQAPEPIVAFTRALRVEIFNRAAEELFGYRASQVLGTSVLNLLSENFAAAYCAEFERLLSEGQSASALNLPRVWTGRRADGVEFPLEAYIFKMEGAGEIWGTAMLRDISAREAERRRLESERAALEVQVQELADKRMAALAQMERELRTSEARYRGMIESQQALIVRVDAAGRFTYVNDVYCRTFGRQREELLGKTFQPLVHPDDLAATLEAMKGLVVPPHRIYVEQRALTTDGWRWLAWEDYAIRDEDGATVEIQGVGTDITEQKRAEESLRVQRDLGLRLGAARDLSQVLDAVLDAACSIEGIDSGGIYLFDRARQNLALVAHRGLSNEFIEKSRRYDANTPQVQMVRQGKPLYINYVASGQLDNLREKEKLLSVTVFPILFEGQVIAAVNLGSHTHVEIPMSSRASLDLIASQVGSALTRTEAEAALRESERNLQTLFDTLDDFLFILDDAGNIVQVNPVVLNRLGYAREELVGQSVLMLHPQARRQEALAIITAMLRREADACPVPLACKDGRLIPVETKVTRGFWGEHSVLFGISRDISARQRAEIALRRHAEILEAVDFAAERFLGTQTWAMHMPDVLARLGQAAEVSRVYVFEVVAEISGEFLCSQRYEWCAPGIEPQQENPELQNFPLIAGGFRRWADALRAGKRISGAVANFPQVESETLAPQGIHSLLVVPILVGGTWWGFVGFDDCETEREWEESGIDALEAAARILGAAMRRQQIETSLEQSKARNAAIVNAIPDLMFWLNQEGRILDYKASQLQDLVRSPDQIVGMTLREILPPPVAELALQKVAATLDSGQLQMFEYELPMPRGTQTFEARLVPNAAPDAAADTDQVLAIVRNISERAVLEQMKSDFINRAAHELRTPLTTVIMMAELLQGGGSQAEMQVYWQVMQRELKRQRMLVEQLLTAGRLEKGSLQIAFTQLSLADALRDAQSTVQPQADAKQITLEMNFGEGKWTVNASPDSLQQVFVNLLSNAVKFTPAGGNVQVEVAETLPGVTVSVCDTGIGIPANEIEYLFTRFFRAQNAVVGEVPGSGIGLYLVKGIVEKLGGHVTVSSELNCGSMFQVWLPLAQESPARI